MARLLSSFRHRQPTLTAGVALSYFHPDRSRPPFLAHGSFVRGLRSGGTVAISQPNSGRRDETTNHNRQRFPRPTARPLVILAWTLHISPTSPTQLTAKAALSTLACLTCPIALAHRYPLSLNVALLANAATYALVGVLAETIRQHYQTRSLSN